MMRVLEIQGDEARIGWDNVFGVPYTNTVPLASYRRALVTARQVYAEGDTVNAYQRAKASVANDGLRQFLTVVLPMHACLQARDEWFGDVGMLALE